MQESSLEQQGPILLIDENPAAAPLAQALHLVDYNAVAATEQFGQGELDPTLIQWVGLQQGIWVTADEKAKLKHSEEIKNAGIHILWVHRPKQGMSKKAQLLLLLWIINDILQEVSRAKGPVQFLARHVGKRPKLERL